MAAYQPRDFWEKSHSSVAASQINLGSGVRHVGGGESDAEADALYRLRQLNTTRVLDKCQLPRAPRMFELGSGGGYWVDFFRRLTPKVFVGSDLSATAVERLSARYPDYGFVCMRDGEAAWSRIDASGPYDLSLAIDVLYHITDDTVWELTLNHLCAVTVEGGILLLADYFYDQPIDEPSKAHVKHRPIQTYIDILDSNGFRIENVQPIFYLLNRIVSGPWRDDNRIMSATLRVLSSNSVGLGALAWIDAILTRIVRPMNKKTKTRFVVARKIGSRAPR